MKTSHNEDCYFYNLKDSEYFRITLQLFDLEWENFYSENLLSFKDFNQESMRLPIIDPIIENFIVYLFFFVKKNLISLIASKLLEDFL